MARKKNVVCVGIWACAPFLHRVLHLADVKWRILSIFQEMDSGRERDRKKVTTTMSISSTPYTSSIDAHRRNRHALLPVVFLFPSLFLLEEPNRKKKCIFPLLFSLQGLKWREYKRTGKWKEIFEWTYRSTHQKTWMEKLSRTTSDVEGKKKKKFRGSEWTARGQEKVNFSLCYFYFFFLFSVQLVCWTECLSLLRNSRPCETLFYFYIIPGMYTRGHKV